MADIKAPVEPFRIKVVEPILHLTTRREREALLKQSGLNVFGLPAEKVDHRPADRLRARRP